MGGSGGGGAGAYPDEIANIHGGWLDGGASPTGAHTGVPFVALRYPIAHFMNEAFWDNPWSFLNPYDPSGDLDIIGGAAEPLCNLANLLSGDPAINWREFLEESQDGIDNVVITEAFIQPHVTAHAAILQQDIDTRILPAFRSRMYEIGSVQASSFTIGEAIILGFHSRDVAEFEAQLRTKLTVQRNELIMRGVDQMIAGRGSQTEAIKLCTHYRIEATRLKSVGMTEYYERLAAYSESRRRWPLEVFMYGGNLMASGQGGTIPLMPAGPSKTQSVMGGALSGASVGGQIGGSGYSTGIGAVIGGLAGLLG